MSNFNPDANIDFQNVTIQGRRTKLLDTRKDCYVIHDIDQDGNAKVRTIPKTPYTNVKYGMFKGERIYYKFDEGVFVQETFNDGIFNCTYGEMFIQINDRRKIIEAIIKHVNSDDKSAYTGYANLVSEAYYTTHRMDGIKIMLESITDRVVIDEKAVEFNCTDTVTIFKQPTDGLILIDDGLFAIDSHGNAYQNMQTWNNNFRHHDWALMKCKSKTMLCCVCGTIIPHGEQAYYAKSIPTVARVADTLWCHRDHVEQGEKAYVRLCLVVGSYQNQQQMKPITIPTPSGPIILDINSQSIIAKALFLLNPNLEDKVFTQQLTPTMLANLKNRAATR